MFRVQVVNKYIDEGIAELIPGVLFIDEVPYIVTSQSSVRHLLSCYRTEKFAILILLLKLNLKGVGSGTRRSRSWIRI